MLKQRSSGSTAFNRAPGVNRVLGSVLLAATLALGGCGLLPEVKDETAGWSAQKLYSEAKDNLNSGNYERAVKLFETLESRYPFGRYAQQAQLEVAYAYYKDNEPISADRRMRPLHQAAPESPQRRLRLLPERAGEF